MNPSAEKSGVWMSQCTQRVVCNASIARCIGELTGNSGHRSTGWREGRVVVLGQGCAPAGT